jgi:multiple sugar transport system ATP-binding protein
MASVGIRDVKKAFGTTPVIHGVDITINDGEFVVLVGPSGCGKSTLLRMIAGLENITGGEIRIGERVVNNVPPKERDIAMVFQNYALYPHMTVAANMGFSLKLRDAPKAEIDARVSKAADILGLKPLLERYPRQLSGGQRQRVAMGRAIVRDPQVFLFDEPLSNLDAKLRVAMRTEIKELHQRLKTTTVYVTHDQIEAMTMAPDRTGGRWCTASGRNTSPSRTTAPKPRSWWSSRPVLRLRSSPSLEARKLSRCSASVTSSSRATRFASSPIRRSSICSMRRREND